VVKSFGRREALTWTGIHRLDPGQGRYVTATGAEAVFEGPKHTQAAERRVANLNHYIIKSLEEFEEKLVRGNANAQRPGARRRRLEHRFKRLNAGGERNADIGPWTQPMRREALRLCSILTDRGIHYPVWPFVEAGGRPDLAPPP
jgi:hypothetical protein